MLIPPGCESTRVVRSTVHAQALTVMGTADVEVVSTITSVDVATFTDTVGVSVLVDWV